MCYSNVGMEDHVKTGGLDFSYSKGIMITLDLGSRLVKTENTKL